MLRYFILIILCSCFTTLSFAQKDNKSFDELWAEVDSFQQLNRVEDEYSITQEILR